MGTHHCINLRYKMWWLDNRCVLENDHTMKLTGIFIASYSYPSLYVCSENFQVHNTALLTAQMYHPMQDCPVTIWSLRSQKLSCNWKFAACDQFSPFPLTPPPNPWQPSIDTPFLWLCFFFFKIRDVSEIIYYLPKVCKFTPNTVFLFFENGKRRS